MKHYHRVTSEPIRWRILVEVQSDSGVFWHCLGSYSEKGGKKLILKTWCHLQHFRKDQQFLWFSRDTLGIHGDKNSPAVCLGNAAARKAINIYIIDHNFSRITGLVDYRAETLLNRCGGTLTIRQRQKKKKPVQREKITYGVNTATRRGCAGTFLALHLPFHKFGLKQTAVSRWRM